MAELKQHYAEMHARNAENKQGNKAWADAWRPSGAMDSQGRVVGSDLGQDEGFFGDMESYRKNNMGTGFEHLEENGSVSGFHPQQDIREMDPARIRPSEQATGGMSAGQSFVQKALAGTNRMPSQSQNDNFHGNQDPNDDGLGAGGKTVADDDITPGGGPAGKEKPWIRNLQAPGRFGLRRSR